MNKMLYKTVGDVISKATIEKCGNQVFPILSMTMKDGIIFQNEKFKKQIASVDQSTYNVVRRKQLVVSFPIDEGVLAVQDITDAGIVSPAYKIWNIDESRIIPKYLELFLRSPHSIQYYKSKLRGSTARRRSITDTDFLSMIIPQKSLSEQQNIIDNLNLAQSIITHRKQQLEKLDELVKARFVEMFGDVKTNPYNYEKLRLGKTCKITTGNTPSRSVEEYYGDYIEWIKTDNIVTGKINPTSAIECLSEEGMKVGRTVDKGSVLMACIAGSVTSIGRVCITDRKVAFNQQINAITPENYDVNFLYVMLQLSKEYLVEEINMSLKGILSKSKLEDKMFFVPPLELQQQFATFVEQTDKSKVVVQKALDKAQLLFDSLMQEYFG